MNQIKLDNDNIIYTSEITQKQFDCFSDNLTDWISVYPDGNLNFLCKWLKHFRIEIIRDMISLSLNNETVLYLFKISNSKMIEFANILYPPVQNVTPDYNYSVIPFYVNPEYNYPTTNYNQQKPFYNQPNTVNAYPIPVNNYSTPLSEINTNTQTPISVYDIEKNISTNNENDKKFKVYIPPHKRNIM